MKKVLTILSSLSIIVVPTSTIISCGEKEPEVKKNIGDIITEFNLGKLEKDPSSTNVERPSKETIYNKLLELHKQEWEEKKIDISLDEINITESEWTSEAANLEGTGDRYTGKALVLYELIK
ncbi:hypothetical protein SLITO_v1c05070 [Spiroplasma litorale]|uniref:Lipoprotein n=1 Tax=Spiroplasma litorale TaxID=216942 RepID=A0A0K1W1V2_9MOLU|nr:hypothetical protein [Spiroplasma litorale]AKX34158.1 hypothetical protein SLITO_v1c05070 [Spiroplasma litorale]